LTNLQHKPEVHLKRLFGEQNQCRKILLNMATESAADEFVILTICRDPVAGRKSYELIAQAFTET